jgi:hypothetical protein
VLGATGQITGTASGYARARRHSSSDEERRTFGTCIAAVDDERIVSGARMPNIVAGRFEQQADADAATASLVRHGFRRDQVASFFVNAAGQHAQFPLGGDRAVSPGTQTAGGGAAVGAAVGGAVGLGVGLAVTPVVGPVAVPAAAGVGTYVGSLAGALGELDAAPADSAPYAEAHAEVRHAGVMVAVHAPKARQHGDALEVLRCPGHKISRPRTAIGATVPGSTSIRSTLRVPSQAGHSLLRGPNAFASESNIR